MLMVTGGSGFLGMALAKRLIEMGNKVRLFDKKRPDDVIRGAEFLMGDIRNKSSVVNAGANCEIIFHLVGIMPQARAKKEVMQEVNVGGTRNVLESAVKNGVRRVVFISSSEVYGYPERIPIREEDKKSPIGEYGGNKLESEGLCLEYKDKYGLEVVILRPSTIVGPGISERLFLKFLDFAYRGKTLFYLAPGTNRFQMTSLNDCVNACIISSQKEGISGEAFNIGADDTLSMKEQLLELKRRTGITSRLIPLPAKTTKFALKLLYPLGLSPLEPDHFHLADVDYVMDCSKAKSLLGWKPVQTNLDMIIETYEWYKSNKTKARL